MKRIKQLQAPCLFLIAALILGCATTGPFREFAPEVNRLRMGMIEGEVRALLGSPWIAAPGIYQEEYGEQTGYGWDYRRRGQLGQDLHLTVFFKDGRVVGWREWRPALNL